MEHRNGGCLARFIGAVTGFRSGLRPLTIDTQKVAAANKRESVEARLELGGFNGVPILGCNPSDFDWSGRGHSHANAPLGTQVTVSTGTLSGLRSTDGLKQFFHIPYAKAPLDELRWLPPRPAESWTGVRDASKGRAGGMQVPAQEENFSAVANTPMDEDCLHLNVWSLGLNRQMKNCQLWFGSTVVLWLLAVRPIRALS